MKFSLVICTYLRPQSLLELLHSVKAQTLYPNEIIIVDGSINDETDILLKKHTFKNLEYFKVDASHRGLTKQRNFGIQQVAVSSQIICFLDDDTVLKNNYFETIILDFKSNSTIIGVGGVAVNENRWEPKIKGKSYSKYHYYMLDNWVCKEGLRNVVRNYLGLSSPLMPNRMPDFSNGRTCSYPLTGQCYEVDLLIGMSMNFRSHVFKYISFSTYFEGYGLYEDADFSIRAQRYGKLVLSTAAQLVHHHDGSGRPNRFNYGKMVIRNGWYVWRVKYQNPSTKAQFKWHATALLLTIIRFTNIFTTDSTKSKEAFTESMGRVVGWFSIIFNSPKIKL